MLSLHRHMAKPQGIVKILSNGFLVIEGTLPSFLTAHSHYLTRARLEPTSDLGKAVLGNWVWGGFVHNCSRPTSMSACHLTITLWINHVPPKPTIPGFVQKTGQPTLYNYYNIIKYTVVSFSWQRFCEHLAITRDGPIPVLVSAISAYRHIFQYRQYRYRQSKNVSDMPTLRYRQWGQYRHAILSDTTGKCSKMRQ